MKNNKTHKYYFIAGEASGDLHGSHLIKNIKDVDSNVSFVGVGGPLMEKQGLKSLVPINQLAVLGFWEVFKKLSFFIKLKKTITEDILKNKPDKIVLVDYPGFNLKIAQAIKSVCNIKIIYYVSPQLWAWKEKRVHIIKKYIDTMIVLFPFEQDWYAKHNFSVVYLGHPLIELHDNFLLEYQKKSFDADYVVALLPGSRKQELLRHLPLYRKIIHELNKKNKRIHYIVKLFDYNNVDIKTALGLSEKNCSIEKESTFNAFHDCDFALVASGTATLEGAISNAPLAVVYKTSWLSWLIARLFLRVPFISIINILTKAKLVEEFLQHDATPKNIASYIIKSLENPQSGSFDYSSIRAVLYKKDIYQNAALEIIN